MPYSRRSNNRKARGNNNRRPTSTTTPSRILLVESNRGVRSIFAYILYKLGYPTVLLNNGIDTLEWLFTEQSNTFGLILLDWHLRDIPSGQICQQLRTSPHFHSVTTPILALIDEEKPQPAPVTEETGVKASINKFAHPRLVRHLVRTWFKQQADSVTDPESLPQDEA